MYGRATITLGIGTHSSLFVSMFVCTITSKRLNVGRSNLTVRYIVQKSLPSSKVKVKVNVTRHKKRKTAEPSPVGGTQQHTIPLRAARG